MVSRLITQTLVWIAAMAAVLFVSAGTVTWPAAWVFLAEMGGFGVAIGLWLARRDPALLAERLSTGFQAAQKTWDKVFMATVFVLWTSWLVLMALDAVRFGWSRMPIWAQAIGAILIALCMYVSCLTFRENSFAAPVVKIASERGHRVVEQRPLRARAPPDVCGRPAVLHRYALAARLLVWPRRRAGIDRVVLAARAVMEERMLADELPGYRDYATRVRYRLIPGLW